jgi:hypothetical protein
MDEYRMAIQGLREEGVSVIVKGKMLRECFSEGYTPSDPAP